MAGSMVGDFTRWIFNDWDIWARSRQDTVVVSNRDEKNRRLSLDMSSSSSTSLSPSVLPTHDASPRYKKTSNFRLTSHRRSSSRQKTPTQNIPASSLSPIEDNSFPTSLSNDSQSSMSTEQDETKTSVTIHVAEALNSRTDPSSVDTCQESKENIDKIGNNHNQKSSDTVEHTNRKLETDQRLIQDENTDSWTEAQQTPAAISNRYDKNRRLTADLTFSESSISPTNNGSSKLQKKNSLKGNRKQNSRSKEQTIIATQESDGEIDSIISDDHSDSLIQQIDTTVPTIQKNEQDSTHEETFIKTGHKRRRRRTRGSKNNQQKMQQNQQTQNSDQRPLKQEQPITLQKLDISQQSVSDASKLRNVSGKIKSESYYFFHNALYNQNTYSKQHHLNEISKSHQAVEKSKVANYDIWERHPHQQYAESHQPSRSDQTVYFLQANKRGSQIYHSANLNSTAIPAKATLPESNRKVAVFPRTDMHWKPNDATSSHASTASHNFNTSSSTSNVPISRFTTYADVISPHNRPSALSRFSRSNTSGLSNGNNITTPVPAASTTNHQWYSPFESGLSIQLTPPVSPQNIHRHLPSTNSNASNSVLSSKQFQDRNRNVIAPPLSLSASNNVPSSFSSSSSSLSMFTSSSFSPTNSSFRESLFGRKHPVQDQEKGELSDETDDSESWNKIMGISELSNQRTWVRQNNDVRKGKFGEGAKNKNINENAWHHEQEPQQQFSLFDKRLSFMYHPNS
jgi:hypothetical protein